jgi:hypothetical protein
MTSVQQPVVIFVPVAGSPGWDRRPRQAAGLAEADEHKAAGLAPATIPTPAKVDFDAIRRLIEEGKPHLAERRSMIEVVLSR